MTVKQDPVILILTPRRWLTHFVLAVITVAACWIALRLEPRFSLINGITVGTGYASLIYIVLTLVIGPWKLLSQRRNPVNIDLRRDTGIWAGFAGVVHVILGFQIHMGGNILLYFARWTENGLRPQINLFGLANYTGAMATLILVVLLVISNDLSVRWLKGPRWKLIQRFNYGLIALVILHTLAYQLELERSRLLALAVLALSLVTLAVQVAGIHLYLQKNRAQRA